MHAHTRNKNSIVCRHVGALESFNRRDSAPAAPDFFFVKPCGDLEPATRRALQEARPHVARMPRVVGLGNGVGMGVPVSTTVGMGMGLTMGMDMGLAGGDGRGSRRGDRQGPGREFAHGDGCGLAAGVDRDLVVSLPMGMTWPDREDGDTRCGHGGMPVDPTVGWAWASSWGWVWVRPWR